MKLTKHNLRRIILEELEAVTQEDSMDDWTSGDYAQAIRDYSKELTGRRNTYGSLEDIGTLTHDELADYYEEMFDSPEAQARRAEEGEIAPALAGDELEYDDELQHPDELSPTSQGMRKRYETVQYIKDIIQEELHKEVRRGTKR